MSKAYNRKPDNRFRRKLVDSLLCGIGVDSYNRFLFFVNVSQIFSDYEYWYGLGVAYTDSDNLYFNRKLLRDCFTKNRRGRSHLMNKKEKKYLKSLPEKVKIYRAMTGEELKSGEFNISWTLKYSIAKFFCNTYLRNHDTNHLTKVIHELTIDKKDIVAYLNERKEFEIIYIHKPKP